MSLNFVQRTPFLNGDYNTNAPQLQFFEKGIYINSGTSQGYQDITVSGENYVNLVNAKSNGLKYLKLYGDCEQKGILPSGYTQLEYIAGNGTGTLASNIFLDLIPNENSIMEIIASTTLGTAQFMVAAASNSSLNLRIAKFTASSKVGASIGSTTYNSDVDGSAPFFGKIDHKKAYVNNVLIGDGSGKNLGTYSGIGIGKGVYASSTYYSRINVYLSFVSIDGIHPDFLGIPAMRNSDDEAGLYDIINNRFYPSDTSDYPYTAGPVINYPLSYIPYSIICNNGELKSNSGQIYVDGTVETVQSKDENDNVLSTATAENLLALYTYKDVQNIVKGTVKRNVGVKILDGTENWAYSSDWSSSTENCFYFSTNDENYGLKGQTTTSNECLCSHFKFYSRDDLYNDNTVAGACIAGANAGTGQKGYLLTIRLPFTSKSADNFKSWLIAQKNNGTPVILVYPLATEVTETVTKQPMAIDEGENTIEITQASIDPLILKVQYKAGVEVTIEEVENVNLDNSVTVTIS